jgi:hypothetical protein
VTDARDASTLLKFKEEPTCAADEASWGLVGKHDLVLNFREGNLLV